MKIKSLLLGSAAAMVAVSGAQAADAIVIEPEPVEYVRVCDAYGAGWFYIPGTETCLRLSGYVRVAYGVAHEHDNDGEESNHTSHFRARLNVQANNETEYGTLSSYIRLQGDGGGFFSDNSEYGDVLSEREGPEDPSVLLDKAYISLAGFTVGYLDNWWSRGLRYGYYNISAFDFGWYNYDDALVLDYTYAANGWTFSVGAEDGRHSGTDGAPDAYAGITYSAGGWFFGGVVYNDSSEGDLAYRVRADYDFGNGFRVGGWYAADDGETDYVKGHVYGVTAAMDLTDSLTLWGGYFDYADQFDDGYDLGYTSWTAGLDWNITNGLLMQLTYSGFAYENEIDADTPNFGLFGVELKRDF